MDQATILKILDNYKAPPTLENINRVMEMSARSGGSRDTEMLGRSLGLQGGTGEEGPGMDLMLDKLMKSTSTPAQMPVDHEVAPQQEARPGRVEVGTPQRVGPSNTASNKGNYSAPAPDAPTTRGDVSYYGSEGDLSGVNAAPTAPSGGIGGLEYLAALLGLRPRPAPGAPPVAPPGAPMRQIEGPARMLQIEGPNPNQPRLMAPDPKLGYEPKLTDAGGAKMESGAPVPPKQPVGGPAAPQTPDDVAKMKGEVSIQNNKAEILKYLRNIQSQSDMDIVRQQFGLTNEQVYALEREANGSPTPKGDVLDTNDLNKPKPPKKTGTQETIEALKRLMGRK